MKNLSIFILFICLSCAANNSQMIPVDISKPPQSQEREYLKDYIADDLTKNGMYAFLHDMNLPWVTGFNNYLYKDGTLFLFSNDTVGIFKSKQFDKFYDYINIDSTFLLRLIQDATIYGKNIGDKPYKTESGFVRMVETYQVSVLILRHGWTNVAELFFAADLPNTIRKK